MSKISRPISGDFPYASCRLRVQREIIHLCWRLAELREEEADLEETLAVLDPEWLADHTARLGEVSF